MLSTLMKYLEHEKSLLEKLLELAIHQQDALIAYDMKKLETITTELGKCATELRSAEEKRIRLLMSWLNVPLKDAAKIRLSSFEKHARGEELEMIKKMKDDFRGIFVEMHEKNTSNRVLANRAKSGVERMISLFSNGNNIVCNVKV